MTSSLSRGADVDASGRAGGRRVFAGEIDIEEELLEEEDNDFVDVSRRAEFLGSTLPGAVTANRLSPSPAAGRAASSASGRRTPSSPS